MTASTRAGTFCAVLSALLTQPSSTAGQEKASAAWLHGDFDLLAGSVSLAVTRETRWAPASNESLLQKLGVQIKPLGKSAESGSGNPSFQFLEPGLSLAPSIVAQGEGSGFLISIPARRRERVVRLYLTMSQGRALVAARIPGGGARFYTDTSFSSNAEPRSRTYTFNGASLRDGTLEIEARILSQRSGEAKLSLWAISVTEPGGNQAPRVEIVSPAPRSRFEAPAEITLEAKATDSDGEIAKVVFYDWSLAIKLGEVTRPPYRLTLKRPTTQWGSLTARAYDNHGKATDSEPVRYIVRSALDRPPPAAAPLYTGYPSPGLPGTGWEGASSLAELPDGDVFAVWYAGKYELSPDSRVYASIFSKRRKQWSAPRPIMAEPNVSIGNTVVSVINGKLWCFYTKVFGDAWEYARIYYRISSDRGRSWGPEVALPQPEFRYPTGTLVSTKPLQLRNGDILLPLNRESYDPDPVRQWYSLFLISTDGGKNWAETQPIYSQPGNIQPAVEQLADGSLIAFFRPRGRGGVLWLSRSRDNGRTWDPLTKSELPNPSARVALGRLPNGRLVLAFNDHPVDRTPLSLALSTDEGRSWSLRRVVDSGGYFYTYPSLIVTRDGEIHVAYDDNRHGIKHAVVNERWFSAP